MFSSNLLGRLLIFVGIFVVIMGLLFIFWNDIPFLGNLPGDITVERGNFRFFFPIVTGLVISLALTIAINLILWLIRK